MSPPSAGESPSNRPLLRMRWGKAVPASEPTGTIEHGTCLRFSNMQYTLSDLIGSGAHCSVWRCLLVSAGSRSSLPNCVALKVHNKEANALHREAAALRSVRAELRDGALAHLFPELLGTVKLFGRTCLILPALGPDLYMLQKKRNCQPFRIDFAWSLANQLFQENPTSAHTIYLDPIGSHLCLYRPIRYHPIPSDTI